VGDHKINPFARGTDITLPLSVIDGFGRQLTLGDLVALNQPLGVPAFSVLSITPSVDPRHPPNTLEVRLRTEVKLLVKADTPVQQLILIYAAAEARAVKADGGGGAKVGD
jgi:hypothetical protein